MNWLAKPLLAWSAFLGLLVVWGAIVFITRNHACAMGFGGISCRGLLQYLGLYNLFFGWIPVAMAFCWAVVASIVAMLRKR